MLKRLVSIALAVVLTLGVAAAVLARPAQAAEITPMHVSEELVELVKDMEGFRAIPYWDYGQWTVGFGTACPEEDRARYTAEGIPPEEAHALMMKQMEQFESDVNAFMVRNEVQLNQHQFDALVSFVYNVGSAVLYNNESNVINAVINGAEGNEFMFAIGQWCTAGGEILLGLLRRRMVEAYMYLYGTYAAKPPESFCYVKYDANGGDYEGRVQGYDSNLAAVPLSVPTRAGYIFTGWYTAASGGQKVTALDETTNGITLYAHWEAGTPATGTPTDPETGITVTVIDPMVSIRQTADATANIISHVYRGEKITITGLTENNDVLWGYCRKGWISLEHTDYYEVTGEQRPDGTVPEQEVKVPIKATVLSSSGVKVYNGPDTTYIEKGTLAQGDSIEIIEVMTFCAQLWGRYEGGWVCLNQKILLHDENALAHEFVATITQDRLNVRSGPGTHYGVLSQLRDGAQVEIFAITLVEGVTWGRYVTGWICLDSYTDYDASQLSYYQSHSYGDWSTTTEATCSQVGQLRRDCQHCEHYELQQIPKVEHSLGEWYVSDAGNCVTVGKKTRECKNCDYAETADAELGDHVMGDWNVSVAATCVTEGQEYRNCTLCDHSETRVTGLGSHSFGDWAQTVAPGCETAGQEQRNCKNCTHTETKEVAATGHSFGDWAQTVAPGCETAGQEQRTCKNCSHAENRGVAATGHSFSDWAVVTAPGCETVGQEQRSCKNCSLVENKEVAATGHSFGQWYEKVTPTAETEGEARRDCANCDHFESKVLPVNPHTYGDWYVHTAATCSAPGEERRNCSHCDQYESRAIAAIEHTYGQWTVSVVATCVTVGQEKRECTVCGHCETREGQLGDHSFGEWYTSVTATCVTVGQEKRDCQLCDHFETKETALGSHSYGDWTVTQAPGCETAGQEQRNCKNCTHAETRGIIATGHNMGQWSVTQAATCTAEGQEQRKCTACDHTESRATEKIAHSYGDWFVSQAATCTAEGQEQRKCTACDHTESRATAKAEHSYGEWYVVTAPTIDQEGQQGRKCVNCDATQTETLPVLPSVEKIFATITVTSLNVRADASSGATKVGTVLKGVTVEILEQKTVNETVWGRIEYGWLCLSGYATLETVRQAVVTDDGDKTYATITSANLTFRAEASVSASSVGNVYKGMRLRVYETTVIDDMTWGRTAFGWLLLTGYTTIEVEPGVHKEHTYGEWYVAQAGTCVAASQERRDCTGCDHFETREGQLGEHSFGDWYTSTAATCVTAGQEKRYCQLCDHFEARETALSSHSFGEWTQILAPGCETVGQEQRSCQNCSHAETRETAVAGHQFGQWSVTQAATCTAEGQEQRKCTACDHAESRAIAMADHSYGDWYVVTQPTVDQEGQKCRKCANCDATQTETLPVLSSVERVFATITVSSLNVRADASSSAAKVGSVIKGVTVEILEQKTVNGVVWGRIEFGWICLTGYATMETVREPATVDNGDKVYATITCSSLYIRPQAGVSAGSVASVYKGVRVRIYETTVIDDATWGRTELGWLYLTGNTSLETEPGQHTEHTFGQWYVSQAGTCVAVSQERRDCTGCDHYETREGQLGEHSYGDWYVAVAPGCEQAGQERRDCAYCDLFETRETSATGHSMGQWYVSGAPTCENPGSQCRDCENCDYIESQPIDAFGHSFGQWYVTQEPTTTQVGQERRDCGTCGHYETREVEKLPVTVRVYGTFNGSAFLNIREGAGTGYASVGKLLPGVRVEILEQKDVDGTLWGRIESGWVCITGYIELEYVNVTYVSITKLYATVTASVLSIYQEADSTASQLGALNAGAVVQILQISTIDGVEWGRTEAGWICMTGAVTLATTVEEVEEGTADTISMYATVTCASLNMREDASASANYVGALKRGTVVEILEIKTVNGVIWGRTASGWICLSGNATLSTGET